MMQPRVSAHLLLLFVLSVGGNACPQLAYADDPCAAFTWDVRHERSLFAQPPRSLAAGQSAASSPAVATDQLYELKLSAQSKVTFVAAPGGKKRVEGAFAGLVLVKVNTPGVYRVSLDQPVWVDAVAGGVLISAQDFQGRHGCNAPHKVVEFALPAGASVTLQLSQSEAPSVKLTVTRSTAP